MSDDQNPPADVPVEPASVPTDAAEMPMEATEASPEAESTHLPANESISEAPLESISESPQKEKSVESLNSSKPADVPSPAASTPSHIDRELLMRANAVRHENVQKNLDAIMTALEKDSTISNNKVQELLDTSNASAIRYLSILVKEGKIKKSGKGRGVVYTKA